MKIKPLYLPLLALTVLNLLQAAFTHLTHDEAYYRAYTHQMAWGYFDHPPMVAGLIWLGKNLLGDHALGIRFFFVLSQTVALWVVFEKLIPPQFSSKMPLAWLTVLLLHVYGWVATPDAPLLLTTALFFWAYQSFCAAMTWKHTLLLGIAMPLMLFSKYHGVLVILFTVASNIRLALQPRAWVAVVIAVLGFSPHLWWQWSNDFPTLGYHLSERSDEPYVFRHSVEFVVNQLLLFSPVVFFFVMPFAARLHPKNMLERALKYNIFGFPVFCLLLTLKVYSEPHWTYVIVIPMLYFLAQVVENQQAARWLRGSSWVLLPLILVLRICLMFPNPMLPAEFHRTKQGALAIGKAAGDLPVFVANSYQIAATTDFFNHKKTGGIVIANRKSRHHQYSNIWDDESAFQGKTVYVVSSFAYKGTERIPVEGYPGYELYGKRIDDFQFLKKVKITVANTTDVFAVNQPLDILVVNPYDRPIALDTLNWRLRATIYERGWEVRSVPLDIDVHTVLLPQSETIVHAPPLNLPESVWNRPYTELSFSLAGKEEPYPVNSRFYLFKK